MTFVLGLAAIIAGLTLLVFSANTATDPFWSRSTRLAAVVGWLTGLGCFVLGMLTVAST